MRNCIRCNSQLADDAVFCSRCGFRISDNDYLFETQNEIEKSKKKNACSLLAVVFGAIGFIPLLNFIFLPAAIVLAIIGLILSKNRKKGITIASVIVVIISVTMSFISIGWIFPIFSGQPVVGINDDVQIPQTSSSETLIEENYEYISFPDTVITDYFQIDIESVRTSKEIRPSKTNGLYNYKKAESGKQYCYIKGTIKNTSGRAHQISFLGNFIFDNTYTYSGLLLKEVDNGINNVLMYETIQPLEQIEFYYAACIPDETINIYNSAEIKFEIISDLYESSADTKYNKYSLGFSR